MAGSMVYRLRVSALDDLHLAQFRKAMVVIQGIMDNRGYNDIAGIHGVPGWYCWHHQKSISRQNITARLFLPWHRAYLWWLEQAMQDQVARIALPWWDWTRDRKIPDAYATEEVDGAPNPLYNFYIRMPPPPREPENRDTWRNPGSPGGLPTVEQIKFLLNLSDWASFSDLLQDYHDRVHGWVGGDMGSLAFAAFDPVFYAHHCMIDRIWYLWQVKHGNGGIPSDLLGEILSPFGKRFRDVLDVQTLGYEYAETAVDVVLNGENND